MSYIRGRKLSNTHRVMDGQHLYEMVRKINGHQLSVRLYLDSDEYEDRSIRNLKLREARQSLTEFARTHYEVRT